MQDYTYVMKNLRNKYENKKKRSSFRKTIKYQKQNTHFNHLF